MKRELVVLLSLIGALGVAASARPLSPNVTELQTGWRMTSAQNVAADDSSVSLADFDASSWYSVQRMPATVLQVLEDNGVYRNLYYGTNLATAKDLWKQDWWYRTTFVAPAGREVSSLIFEGVNYRADIWL